jgi:flagellar biosynthesis anti-sigma factor FlgM
LSVSSGAQFIAAAQATLVGVPEVRTEKVEAIRAQISSDSYNPPADAVAEGLVKAHSPQRMGT